MLQNQMVKPQLIKGLRAEVYFFLSVCVCMKAASVALEEWLEECHNNTKGKNEPHNYCEFLDKVHLAAVGQNPD